MEDSATGNANRPTDKKEASRFSLLETLKPHGFSWGFKMTLFIIFVFVLYISLTTIVAELFGSSNEVEVLIGTGTLGTISSLAVFNRIKIERFRDERVRAIRSIEGFYSPLIKIFTSKPDAIMYNKDLVKKRADELVEVLLGKTYLAISESRKLIPSDVEHIAYYNWLEDSSNTEKFSPILGYLCFANEEELKPWEDFAEQVWKDYVYLQNTYHRWYKNPTAENEPSWNFYVKNRSTPSDGD